MIALSPMLKDFTPRLYQQKILNTAAQKNALVVLPTGLGKTAVALMLACHRMRLYPKSKVLILAPTKPLVEQHKASFLKYADLRAEDVAVFTGNVSPEKRAALWNSVRVVFSTPQGLENDLLGNRIDIKNVSLLVVDEAHRSVGEYAYVYVAKTYMQRADNPKILALTASPGADMEKITEVCSNLFIDDIEVRTETDADVKPYVHEIDAEYVRVDLPPEFAKARAYLVACYRSKLDELKKQGARVDSRTTKKQLLGVQREILAQLKSGERTYDLYRALSLIAEAIKCEHALETLESQGVAVTATYLDRLFAEAATGKVKAVQHLVKDANMRLAYHRIKEMHEGGIEHPKLNVVRTVLSDAVHDDKKAIVFTQYRDTATRIVRELEAVDGLKPQLFVGQQKRNGTGISQKQQVALLDDFRNGVFNVLVATSVAEEGLDIPQVDTVVFYEPIPSAIRHIQRRGRTGRQQKGSLKVLVAKNTRDEAYRWTAHHRERKMKTYFDDIKKRVTAHLKTKPQPTLAAYMPEDTSLKIYADHREKTNGVVSQLADLGVTIQLAALESADYVLSSRVGVELKTVHDFVDSIIDGRLLGQLKALRERFVRPLLVIQGTEDIYSVRHMHANAINGMLSTIAVSYGIPMLWTRNVTETAHVLMTVARREQEDRQQLPQLHHEKKITTIKHMQEYLVAALPHVGSSLAKQLLSHFGRVHAVMNASVEELQEVEGVGEKKAALIFTVLHGPYLRDI